MSDRDRPLNPRGYKDAPRIGAYMAHHSLRPDWAVVSDSRRTRETWEGVATALPRAPAATFEDALYNAESETILELARESPASVRSILMVGHNPGLHDAARRRCGARPVQRGAAHLGIAGDRFRGQRLDKAAAAQRPARALHRAALAQGVGRLIWSRGRYSAAPPWQTKGSRVPRSRGNIHRGSSPIWEEGRHHVQAHSCSDRSCRA
jgi:phosphohistidine phosphatase SixA